MKITVRLGDIEIVVDEDAHKDSDRTITLRYSDQTKQVQETLVVMTDQVVKLKESTKNKLQ